MNNPPAGFSSLLRPLCLPSVAFALLCALVLALAPGALCAQAQTGAQTGAKTPKPPVPASSAVALEFQGKSMSLSVTDLVNLPQVTVQVHNAHRGGIPETYTGPLLSDVLARIGFVATRQTQPLILHSVVIATGTDHYYVLYSAAEAEPSFSLSKVLVAVMKNGLPDSQGGDIELINTDGAKPARWVQGLMGLSIMSLEPQK
ncbi:MAG: hypothetical protein ACLGQU_03275 [Acidobacteriota bacterium]